MVLISIQVNSCSGEGGVVGNLRGFAIGNVGKHGILEGGEKDEYILKAGDVGLEYQMSKTYSRNLLRNVWGDSADDARERAWRQAHRGWVNLERPNSPSAMPPCVLLSPFPPPAFLSHALPARCSAWT